MRPRTRIETVTIIAILLFIISVLVLYLTSAYSSNSYFSTYFGENVLVELKFSAYFLIFMGLGLLIYDFRLVTASHNKT